MQLYNAECWQDLLLRLNNGYNTITYIEVFVRNETFELTETENLLWQVLSHPDSKINSISIEEESEDAFARSAVMRSLKRWCMEIPAKSAREVQIWFHANDTERCFEVLECIRDSLQAPNNRVEVLDIRSLPISLNICETVLRPVLEDPNNDLTALCFGTHEGITNDEAVALSRGLTAAQCKLERFVGGNLYETCGAAVYVLEALHATPNLEVLELWNRSENPLNSASDVDRVALLMSLARLLKRPGNKVENLTFDVTWKNSNDSLHMFSALLDEHCCLHHIECDIGTLALAEVLCHPKTTVRSLTIRSLDLRTALALGESLKHPDCTLEQLTIGSRRGATWEKTDEGAVKQIAEALTVPKVNNLRMLEIDAPVRASDLKALADSLRSPNNRLENLHVHVTGDQFQLYRAVRISNIKHLSVRPTRGVDPFLRSFKRFFHVLQTLLSIKHVPRLGKTAWLSLIPVQDFIFRIAQILGWSLDDLRV